MDAGESLIRLDGEDKPEAVEQAERTVRRLGLGLGGTGATACVLWVAHVLLVGLPVVPLSWLGFFLVALVLFFFFPQTRRARLAREVLEHWDDVQVRGLLEASGSSTDPRLLAAEKMGERIGRHPGATPEMRQLATELVAALRQATQDQRLLEVVASSRGRGSGGAPFHGSLSDSLDYVEARAGDLLGALTDLHGAVVRRDAQGVKEVLETASRTLSELEVLEDLDRLLDGEDEGA